MAGGKKDSHRLADQFIDCAFAIAAARPDWVSIRSTPKSRAARIPTGAGTASKPAAVNSCMERLMWVARVTKTMRCTPSAIEYPRGIARILKSVVGLIVHPARLYAEISLQRIVHRAGLD